ncbi:MAG: hypothetical protein MUC60_03225 [Oscillatoria sp. Prado101]|jgi:hypothetical protein|nr:hypothetical protein [Oscillatoria sp. Prado101]
MAILLTTFYTPTKPERAQEFITCLERNLAHPYIEAIKVLFEVKDREQGYGYLDGFCHKKLEIIPVNHRSTYADLIAAAQTWKKDDIAILVNGDIYFDENSNLARAEEIKYGEFWTVSRYEPTKGGAGNCLILLLQVPMTVGFFAHHYHRLKIITNSAFKAVIYLSVRGQLKRVYEY